MSLIDDILSYFSRFEYNGNSSEDYLAAIILFVVSYFLLYSLKVILIGRIKSWIKKRNLSQVAEDTLDKAQKSLGYFLILVLSITIALQPLTLPSKFTSAFDILLFLTLSYYLLKLAFLFADILVSLQMKITDANTASMSEFIRLALKTIFTIIIGMWFLSNLGIDTNAFIASFGVFALAIAFALQNVISDIFAALVIYIDKPVEIEDYVQIGGDIGQVEKIGIRSTRIRTLNGHLLIISNREIINSRIYNFKRMEQRRVAFVANVSMETPLSVVKELPAKIEQTIKEVENIKFDRVYLTTINKYSYDFEIVYYVLSRSYSTYQSIHQEVNLKIIELFEENKITIPYPTQYVQVVRNQESD